VATAPRDPGRYGRITRIKNTPQSSSVCITARFRGYVVVS
jgi:hypothetical protein